MEFIVFFACPGKDPVENVLVPFKGNLCSGESTTYGSLAHADSVP